MMIMAHRERKIERETERETERQRERERQRASERASERGVNPKRLLAPVKIPLFGL